MNGKFLKWIHIKEIYSEKNTLIFRILGNYRTNDNGSAEAQIVYSSSEDFLVNQKMTITDLDDSEVWEDVTPEVGKEYISIVDLAYGRTDAIRRVVSFDEDALNGKLSILFNNGGWTSLIEFFKKYVPVDDSCGQGYTEGYLAGHTGLRWL
jgi:hypothetical protein